MKLVLNIGLNSKDAVEDLTTLSRTILNASLVLCRVPVQIKLSENGGGNWEKERVAILEIDLDDKDLDDKGFTTAFITYALRELCYSLRQDAIAYKLDGVGSLVFHRNYKGERFKFSEEFFQNI